MRNVDFKIQIGSVYGLEPNILMRASMIAQLSKTNIGYRQKYGLAGPNDIIYILAQLDFWKDILPFAAKAVSAGTLGAVGKNLWDRWFGTDVRSQLENLNIQQKALLEAFERLNDEISKTDRYWHEESQVRFGLPSTTDQTRDDIGFVINDPSTDPAIAILAINAIGPEIVKLIDEAESAEVDQTSETNAQITGDIEVESDGSITATIRVNGETRVIQLKNQVASSGP